MAVVHTLVPDFGDGDAPEVAEVLVNVGDRVSEDTPIVLVESDKVSLDVAAGHAGVVTEVKVAVGEALVVGGQLCAIETGESAPSEEAVTEPSPETISPAPAVEVMTSSAAAEVVSSTPDEADATTDVTSQAHDGTPLNAGPATRRLARELGVSLQTVEPTGPRHRIRLDDVKQAVEARVDHSQGKGMVESAPVHVPSDAGDSESELAAFGPVRTERLSRARRVAVTRMSANWSTIPQVTQCDHADVTDVEVLRKALKASAAKEGVKLSPLAFAVQALARVLKSRPDACSAYDAINTQLVVREYVHIGIAVDTPNGLLVPVLRDVDTLGLFDISRQITDLAARARAGTLSAAEMRGGTFTVSSLGAAAGGHFTPLINGDQAGILGISGIADAVVPANGGFAVRSLVPVSLTYDHRILDGVAAARLLKEVCHAWASTEGVSL